MSTKRQNRWKYGEIVTAPSANTKLVTHIVTIGRRAYIMGFWINTTDQVGNDFRISWVYNGQPKSLMVVFGGAGTVKDVEGEFAINEAFSADPQSAIIIENTKASTIGDYQALLLIAEEAV